MESRPFAAGFVLGLGIVFTSLAACGPVGEAATLLSKGYGVPSAYEPLKSVRELSSLPSNVATTVYATTFTHSLPEFHANYPPGSVEEAAFFRHERVHAQRQFEAGDVWFARYAADADFRWGEEKLGYREEIVWLRLNGRQVDPAGTAAVLSGPAYNLGGRMVSCEEAYAWVQAVLASVQ